MRELTFLELAAVIAVVRDALKTYGGIPEATSAQVMEELTSALAKLEDVEGGGSCDPSP